VANIIDYKISIGICVAGCTNMAWHMSVWGRHGPLCSQ